MPKIAISFKLDQIKQILQQLSPNQKSKLVKELEKDTWQLRFKQLLNRIDKRVKKNPISEKEITEIVEQVRKQRHDRGNS